MSLCALLLGGLLTSAATGPQAPTHLRCEYLANPQSVAVATPRLSWEVVDPRRDARQTAYRVLAASDPSRLREGAADLWDSGRVASERSSQVAYAGVPVSAGQRCYWKVRTWDADGHAGPWSETALWGVGPRTAGEWQGRWISDPTPAPGFAPAHNGYHSQLAAGPEETKWVQVDLGTVETIDAVRLCPARPYDWVPDTPGFLFPVRFRITASTAEDGSDATVVVDRTGEDQPPPGAEPVTYPTDPTACRYLRLTVTRLRQRGAGPEFGCALAELEVLASGRNVSRGCPVSALDSIETGPWSVRCLTDGDATAHPAQGGDALPAPMFRKEFLVPADLRRATLRITARGCYEARLNGRRVGDQILAPEWTDYHKRIQYQTYDVTGLLRAGEANALGVLVGDGWYAGRLGLAGMDPSGRPRGFYGRTPELLAQIEIERTDGTRTVIATDDTWRSTLDGPVRSADTLDCEAQDLRRSQPGWDRHGFDQASWSPVAAKPLDAVRLLPQANEPIRVIEERTPVAHSEPAPGVHVYDLGQNMPGWVRIRARGAPGQLVRVRHAEALDPATGMIYTDNLRGAPQIDTYVLAGEGEETLEPHFTYHGFRYVEITGLAAGPALEDVTGRVFCSSSPEVGSFETSSPLFDQLWRSILWTQRANLMSVPTDCPQRDERLGWMGDISIFAQTGILNMDLAGFFTKWVPDVRDAQARDGRFPDFAPHPFGPDERASGAPGWGDAGVTVPWRMWLNYGDRRILEQHYPAALRWIEFVRDRNPDLLWRNARFADYNDWLNADTLILDGWPQSGGAIPNEVFATAQFAHSTDLVARMAEVLGKREDATALRALADRIRDAFLRAYVAPDGRIAGDTQAGYALALHYGLLPPELRAPAAAHLIEGLERYGGHLSTGIHATLPALMELTEAGRADLAYGLVNARTRPSWGYMIDNGATTIWERWDGYVAGRGFQNPGMNSLNHWALGSVGEWLYRVVLGLSPSEEGPGWERFEVAPQPGGGLTWARGSYRSIRGTISVSWRIEGDRFLLDLTVPVGSRARVWIPTADPTSVREGGQAPASSLPGAAVYEVGAGTYRFEAKARP